MECPLCKNKEIKAYYRTPMICGGYNPVEYYSCMKCGILFVPTEENKNDKI
jgi:DNA-directed RNA polymerase subunit M/transcription elongation factor TFIIS